jgi:SAM-dependent methyltransferase
MTEVHTDHAARRGREFELEWRARFIEFAEHADDDAGIAGWSASGLETRLRQFLAAFHGVPQGALWLDAGCGAGTYSRALVQAGARVVAVDYSEVAIGKARSRNALGCSWAVGDVTRLPFRPTSFDGVLCFGVTQALSNSEPVVRELAAAAKSGAEIWIDGLNGWCLANAWHRLGRWLRGKPMHLRYESPRRLRLLLETAGLREVTHHWMPIFPVRLRKWQWMVETRVVKTLLRRVPGAGRLSSHAFLLQARKSS